MNADQSEPTITHRELIKLFIVLKSVAAEQPRRWDKETRRALGKVESLVIFGPELDGEQLIWVNPFHLDSNPNGEQR